MFHPAMYMSAIYIKYTGICLLYIAYTSICLLCMEYTGICLIYTVLIINEQLV